MSAFSIASLSEFLGDEQAARHVAELVVNQLKVHVSSLDAAVAVGDVRAIRKLAHAIAGSASNVSATSVCERGHDIQVRIDKGNAGDVVALAGSLAADARYLVDEISRWLAAPAGTAA
jgi:HPt (histidine-containing phosphotransfer) domain-containing protein